MTAEQRKLEAELDARSKANYFNIEIQKEILAIAWANGLWVLGDLTRYAIKELEDSRDRAIQLKNAMEYDKLIKHN